MSEPHISGRAASVHNIHLVHITYNVTRCLEVVQSYIRGRKSPGKKPRLAWTCLPGAIHCTKCSPIVMSVHHILTRQSVVSARQGYVVPTMQYHELPTTFYDLANHSASFDISLPIILRG